VREHERGAVTLAFDVETHGGLCHACDDSAGSRAVPAPYHFSLGRAAAMR